MNCVKPIRIDVKGRQSEFPDGLEVPCGKCLACRITKRREWTLRMLHELEVHKDAAFITLTYSDDNIPDNGSLVKRDLQSFFKRLRRVLGERKIRYFACGEYGSITYRPHYHAIIFGLSIHPSDKQLVMRCWNKCDWSVPAIRQRAFGLVEPESIQYVAGYIHDKLSDEDYQEAFKQPVFRISSLGIGRDYCDSQADFFKEQKSTSLFGVKYSLPRYYIKRLGISTDDIRDKAIERDSEDVEYHSGVYIDSETLYRYGDPQDVRSYIIGISQSRLQHERNIKARLDLKSKKL